MENQKQTPPHELLTKSRGSCIFQGKVEARGKSKIPNTLYSNPWKFAVEVQQILNKLITSSQNSE